MKKLIRGIVDFRKNMRPTCKDVYARLALGQRPDTLFIACSDSRVAPNVFASTDPGDLFVVRNVGNLIPPCGASLSDESEAAAIEFALLNLPVTDIIVCGHSECGAMISLVNEENGRHAPHLKGWLRHAYPGLEHLKGGDHNQLSQLNVLQQLEHLKTYPLVVEKLSQGVLKLHGWWFDIKEAEVFEYDPVDSQFHVIDEEYAEKLMD